MDDEIVTYRGLTRETYRIGLRDAQRLYNEAHANDDKSGIVLWSNERNRILSILNNWEILTDDC